MSARNSKGRFIKVPPVIVEEPQVNKVAMAASLRRPNQYVVILGDKYMPLDTWKGVDTVIKRYWKNVSSTAITVIKEGVVKIVPAQ